MADNDEQIKDGPRGRSAPSDADINFRHVVFPSSDVFYKPGDEIVTNLPLQMALYFNVVFFPFWFIVMITMLYLKYDCLTSLFQFILVAAFITVTCIECLRLYLGYVGNLSEKIPELAGFWMLSFLLQLPLQLFLLANEGVRPTGVERAVQGVEVALLLAQLGTGFVALRTTAAHQAHKFHLAQFLAPGPGAFKEAAGSTPDAPRDEDPFHDVRRKPRGTENPFEDMQRNLLVSDQLFRDAERIPLASISRGSSTKTD
ncbi:unnamed protein product [Bemisia tabaci]|uniref:Transmembrane protein 17 n=1 Tax=Bemisia tabaci TaxID=7038 RepID=A0A9P0ALP1_BEMTA|nr:unnamed protein product [Bemisia tabaci]